MALRDHLALKGQIDGNRQVKVQNWNVSFDSGAQRVDTLEGLAGKTPGAGSVEITGTWAVETGGLEFDFISACANGTYHEIQVPIGAKTMVAQGWFQQSGISQSTNASTEATMTFMGELQPLQ